MLVSHLRKVDAHPEQMTKILVVVLVIENQMCKETSFLDANLDSQLGLRWAIHVRVGVGCLLSVNVLE